MGFVFSPSNIMTYKQCPRKFWGQSVSRLIKYKPTKQKSRGILIHEQVQDALRDANTFGKLQEDIKLDVSYTGDRVASVHSDRNYGYKLHIEHEMCMSRNGARVGWWDNNAFLRAKADAFLLHDDKEKPVRVIDIKTGRCWDDDDTQLRIEALLAHIVYGRPLVTYEYWYVDEGETVGSTIDFRNGLDPVRDLYQTIGEIDRAIKNNDFPCQSNRLCKWCDFFQTINCEL